MEGAKVVKMGGSAVLLTDDCECDGDGDGDGQDAGGWARCDGLLIDNECH
jgi:hypothetical protein